MDADLYEHLCGHMTVKRSQLFEEIAKKRTRHLCLVLEDIYQPHNASAVLRSCDCFGVQDLHVIENTNTFELKSEVALGSAKWLSVQRHNEKKNNTADCLNQLKNQGFRIISTSLKKDTKPIHKLRLEKPFALVFGNELNGISDVAREHSDEFVKIPMHGFTESFNISVAAALCLYEIRTRMEESNIAWQLNEEDQLALKIQWAKRSINHGDEVAATFLEQHEPN